MFCQLTLGTQLQRVESRIEAEVLLQDTVSKECVFYSVVNLFYGCSCVLRQVANWGVAAGKYDKYELDETSALSFIRTLFLGVLGTDRGTEPLGFLSSCFLYRFSRYSQTSQYTWPGNSAATVVPKQSSVHLALTRDTYILSTRWTNMGITSNGRRSRVQVDVDMVKVIKHSHLYRACDRCGYLYSQHNFIHSYPHPFAGSHSSSSINQRASLASTRSTRLSFNVTAARRCVSTVQM